MSIINLADRIAGFVPGVTYKFEPPVSTNCILVSGQGGQKQKLFSEGWCLRYEKGIGAFQGRPVGEKNMHFFHVEFGPGSRAIEIPKKEKCS